MRPRNKNRAGAADTRFMLAAVVLARRGLGRTSPNPAVGAVVVRGGRVVGRGFHRQAGAPHAEVVALAAAGPLARGATLYSTLEPCDHQGRTPPCTRAILAAGIARVVVGSCDPNPLVDGRGIARLRRAGVGVTRGVARAECDALNTEWFRFIREGRPFVLLKAALTADGKIASGSGDSRWITGAEARRRARTLRAWADAVLVGAGTVRADDPRLTARGAGRSPLRVVLDGALSSNPAARVFGEAPPGALVVTAEGARPRAAARLRRRGVELIEIPAREGRLSMAAVLAALARRGVVRLLVEGGADVHGQLLETGLWDRIVLFVAPRILGGAARPWPALPGGATMAEAIALGEFAVEKVGRDALLLVDRPAPRSGPARTEGSGPTSRRNSPGSRTGSRRA